VTKTPRDQNGLKPNFDAPLNVKPPPAPDPKNDADLIAALARETRELREKLRTGVDNIQELEARLGRKAPSATPQDKPIVLRHISDIVAEKREPQWLIHKVIESNVLAVIAGARGTFKSFIALDWAMRMALDDHPGVVLSGEGAGLDRRIAAWMNQHRDNLDIAEIPLYALERQLNLTAIAEMSALCDAIKAVNPALEFIVIDTLSKFATGLDENDNGKMAAFLSALSMNLREDLGCTVILVAHSGHGDALRPRGASSLMSNPDAEYIVNRVPQSMTVTVSRERFKDCASLAPLAYEAKIIDLGRTDQYGEPVTSLALVTTDVPIREPPARGNGKNQEKLAGALKEWIRLHPDATHISSIDMHAIAKAQGINKNRKAEVVVNFVANRILTPSVGGWALHGENL
jgi:hypothetical protein